MAKKEYPTGPKPADRKGKPSERPPFNSSAGKKIRTR